MAGDNAHTQLIDWAERTLARSAVAVKEMEATLAQAKQTAQSRGVGFARCRVAEMTEVIENLNKKLESQPVIEQAKGILTARSHVTPDEAFDMLRRASMRSNRKLRDVAAGIVEVTVADNGRGHSDAPSRQRGG
jgi:ANTAR domain-containing protein